MSMKHDYIEAGNLGAESVSPSHRLTVSPSHCRGVSSILAMMFLVIFGSLAAAMAVVAHGNMRTAHSGLQVSRAMSAAETGLVFASLRLQEEASKFIIDRGTINAGFAERLWMGTYTALDGSVTAPPGEGPGIVHAVRQAHLNDVHSFNAEASDASLPTIHEQFGTLHVKPIALSANANGSPNQHGVYVRLQYELVSGKPYVRVTSQGVDGTVTRTLQMDFHITKKIEYAVLGVNRIMVGKNVLIEGPVGSRYGIGPHELNCATCHPLVTRSDFYYLDPVLDAKLDLFFERVGQFDVDGDGRLRPNHPVEMGGLAGTGFVDYTGDGYVDDFDIFMQHYDANGDGMVVYNSALAAAAGLGSLSVEFTADPQLARLIDSAVPDRNGDGIAGDFTDTLLGYNDGVIDARDMYAKVRGRLAFAVSRSEWESHHGGQSYQEIAVKGPVRPGLDHAATIFEIDEKHMLEITTEMFDESHSWFANQSGAPFEVQVASNLGSNPQAEHFAADDPDHPYSYEGFPGYEGVPYGSPAPYDFYQRPLYRNMTFTNVAIPLGTNGLFENCTFIGVTFIETSPDNTDVNWNFAGALEYRDDPLGSGENWGFHHKFDVVAFVDDDIGDVTDTRPYSNNIRFHDCTFLGSVSGVRPLSYTHWRNKVQMTGETRFYIDPNDPDLAMQPDASSIQSVLNGLSPSDVQEMAKSSVMMPGWSFDVGAFTSDPDADPTDVPRIKLQGVIVAGIFDIRGNAQLHGTLLLTYRPEAGAGVLAYMPPDCSTCMASFNTQLGYFGPEDGAYEGISPDDPDFEGFGEIRIRYNPDALLPDGIPWPIKVEPVKDSYSEGGL